ncbi:MAG: 50S ribosomal protein L15 [Candidatus Hydrogenedentes bacterium]|nr:50S ribosomal protein L15 [Candidatus Hydrogenedentota bacterium]
MELHNIAVVSGSKTRRRKRVGRGPGSGHGKTSGRGHKGQKARSGYSRKLGFEGGQMPLNRRIPKRGFHHGRRFAYAIVNVGALEGAFETGAEVTPQTLVQVGLIVPTPGGVKILGNGELTKRFKVTASAVSAGAQRKIEAVGGSVTIVRPVVSVGRDAPPTGKE